MRWIKLMRNSKELLKYCIEKIIALKKVKIVDSSFIVTETHSQRLKLLITIQKEEKNCKILQQSLVVEFSIETSVCQKCNKIKSKSDLWNVIVQVIKLY